MLKKLRNIALKKVRVKIITLLLLIFYVNLSTFSIIHFHANLNESSAHSKAHNFEKVISIPQTHIGISEGGECLLCLFLTQFYNAFLKHVHTQILSISYVGSIPFKVLNTFFLFPTHFDSRAPPSILF
jgi:hypothetical protein